MYLKSIEVNGFKSFANKILFEFPHGITGIVGPNGSGKSNVGDAVRWVLGETSAKQLRGAKMEDVIFSGTQNRKPMGFAYVAITFENKDRRIALDYDEVKVARRVYRSGESEYLLNGSVCRRRDVVELFYDTGIGKEGYSIIGQGQVEKILSGKIEDSRELFDEAAGIAKYKKNRTVTEKSLEQERQNLERVTDVLSELEKRVGPLEDQSKKAKEYLRLKEEEKQIDIELFLHDHQQMEAELKDLNRQEQIVGGDLEETRLHNEGIKAKNEHLKKRQETCQQRQDEADGKLRTLQDEKNTVLATKLQLEHSIESNVRLMEHYQELEAERRREGQEKRTLLAKRQEERRISQEKQEGLAREEMDLTRKIRTLQEKKEDISSQIALEQEKMFSLLNSSSDTKERLGRYRAMEEQLSIRNAEYNSRLIALNAERKRYQRQLEELLAQIEEAKKRDDESHLRLTRLQQEKIDLEGQKQSHLSRMEQSQQEFVRAKSRYEAMAQMAERYDGYNQTIKHIMEQKKTHPEIIGVVADILTLDKEYETAIEIALGGALQNIVTENEAVAKQMITFLKKNRYGRATFLPLTSIRNRNVSVNPMILEDIGVLGVASDLVKVDKRYENLVKSLLGRTVVVDTVDHALLLAKKNNFSLRIVTIDGELLNPGGSITGGAYRHGGNLLGRKREMEENRTLAMQMRQQYQTEKQALAGMEDDFAKLGEHLSEAEKKAMESQLSLRELENEVPKLEERKRELEASQKKMREDHALLKAQLDSIQEEKSQLSSKQQDSEETHTKNADQLHKLEECLQEIEGELSLLEAQLSELLLQKNTHSNQIEFIKAECIRLEGELESSEAALDNDKRQLETLALENVSATSAIETHRLKLGTLDGQMEKAQKQVERWKDTLREVQQKQNLMFKELEDCNERLRLLEKEETRITARQERVNEELETQRNYMWENYEITYHKALEQRRANPDADQLGLHRNRKKEVQTEIRALGHVNVNAIEEYKEVGERYEFLRTQYDDIKEAEGKLVEMIEDLNRQMTELFTERFAEIKEMFSVVFQDLFEGGNASLELMDSENILECGIRITAQPPGKKLQNLLLLSGGEKALTAIALLFAIQNLKPSPFCLLDEIEAALDDANIQRFSKYLKRLAKDTQFIVITHRRGTMRASDALYGITMQEKGVSTLISVDLIDSGLN